MLKRNLKISLRKLFRRKEFTLINVFGLMVGLTTSLFIFLWVNDELSYDRFHNNIGDVYGIWGHYDYSNGDMGTGNYFNALVKGVLDEEYPGIEKAVRVNYNPENQISYQERNFKGHGIYTDEEFLQIFNFPILYGKLEETSLETDNDIVLTESLAQKLFGRADVVGELVSIDKQRDALVRLVVQDPPANTKFQFDYLLSMKAWVSTRSWTKGWGNGAMETYARLAPNADREAVDNKLAGLIASKSDFEDRTLFLKPVADIYLYDKYENKALVGGRIEYVRLFSIIAIFIIVIACINFINLSIAESFKRAREVGVRKVVGASKWALLYQFLIESALIVTTAFVLAIIAIESTLPAFNDLTNKSIEFNLFQPDMILGFIVLIVLTVAISGLYPALVLSSFKTIQALKGKLEKKGSGGMGVIIRKGLVVFQFVIAGFLIFAMLVIDQQVTYIFENDKSVDRENVIVMQNDENLIYRYEQFRNELLKDPSISNVTAIGQLPINIYSTSGDPTWDGKDPAKDASSFKLMFTEQDFIPTMNLELAMGRNFSRELVSDSASVILNEAAIRGMHMDDPLGKRFSMWGIDAKIIGVVKDFHLNSVYDKIDPLVILNWTENTSYVMARATQGQTARALEVMEEVYADFMPGYLFEYEFMEQSHINMYQNELMVKDLARIFGLIAVFISCLGLFGLTSINAERSVKEIGIRKVLGATITNILVRFSRQSLVLPVVASLLMVPLAFFFMNSWLDAFEYHIEIQTWMLVAVVALSLAIAWLTVSFIAWRAARMNPVTSLRNE
jgi:ABC-type lipoprotein release transport system permease subunit